MGKREIHPPVGPLGPQGILKGALGVPRGPKGPWGPKSDAMGAMKFENLPEIRIWSFFGSKICEKKLGFKP